MMYTQPAIIERMFTVMNEHDAGFNKTADLIGVDRSTFFRAMTRSKNPKASTIKNFCSYFKVSPTWVILGIGDKELKI